MAEDQNYFLNELAGINLYQMNVFFSTVEYENFTYAAKKLHTTEATVSRIISNIEKKLKIIIFLRMARKVRLTPAGKILYYEWKRAAQLIEQSYLIALDAQMGHFGQLKIGDVNLGWKQQYLLSAISRFEKKFPDINLKVEQTNVTQLLGHLINGKYEVTYAPLFLAPDFEKARMNWVQIFECKMGITVHKSYHCYNKSDLSLKDIKDMTLILVSPSELKSYSDMVLELFKKHNVKPKDILYAANPETARLELMRGKGFMISEQMFDDTMDEDVIRFELEGTMGGMIIAWDDRAQNPYVKEFVECAKVWDKVYGLCIDDVK